MRRLGFRFSADLALFGGVLQGLTLGLQHAPHVANATGALGLASAGLEDFRGTLGAGGNRRMHLTLANAVAIADVHDPDTLPGTAI